METRKLYYEDCHLRAFSARVMACTQKETGYEIVLDATAFYPEGGGQAGDTGTLGTVRVRDTRERGGDILHLCDGPLAVGDTVQGVIDWERRFDLMQQHTGEHILSGLIYQTFGYHNVGFHMGKDMVEVDFDGPVDPESLAELERRANEAVWKDLPVKCWIPSREELPQVAYRSKRALPWPVRLVQVPGHDSCACCGVHTGRTGEVGLVKIFSCVKFHQGVRLEMLCGRRAYDYLRRLQEQNRLVSQCLSAKPLETGPAARQLKEQLTREKFRAGELEKRVFAAIAQGYGGKGDTVHFEEGLAPGSVRELADAIASTCGGTAAVFSDGNFCLCCHDGDVKDLGNRLIQAFGGRGGGRNGMFQGSVPASRTEILTFFS